MITPEQIKAFAPACDAAEVAEALGLAAEAAELTTAQRLCHFLAQWHVESGGFTRTLESLNYSADALHRLWPARFSMDLAKRYGRTPDHPANQPEIGRIAYGGRMGNTEPGDGFRYIGRGWLQLTGRANYAAASEALGLDLLADPDQAREPDVSGRLCAWFWTTHKLNAAADRDDIEAVTRGVNGGLNGLDDRRRQYARARDIWG